MKLLKRLLRYLLGYKLNILLVIIANLFYAVFSVFTLSLIVPFLSVLFEQVQMVATRPSFSMTSRFVIDTFYYYMSLLIIHHGKMSALIYIAVVMMVLSLLSNACRYFGMFWLAPIRANILKELRNDFYHRLLILPLSFYQNHRKGDIISRIGADVQEVEWSIFSSLQSLCRDPFLIIIFLCVLFSISAKLTLISLLILPMIGALLAYIGKTIRQHSKRAQALLGKMSSLFDEAIGGLRVIKGYNAIDYESKRFQKENFVFYRLHKKIFRINELGAPLIELLCVLAILLISVIGLVLLPNSSFTSGPMFMLYFVVFARLIPPAKAFTTTYYTMQKGLSAAARIYEIMDADEKIMECENPIPIHSLKDSVEFKDVSFTYKEVRENDNDDVLKHVNFTLSQGRTMALVGPSGAGKSTIVDLLPRFYDASEGEILVDGISSKQYKISDLRSLFVMVNQDVILFNDTVYNNIVFGLKDVTPEQVIAAAKIAQAHDFIQELEDGYDTVLGDRGMRLSGGQRQRISIARAILRNPQVLILDEATSALDNESEYLFQEALMPLLKERTGIVIAHRLSTIRFADTILFVKEGRIVEQGSHEELMKLQGEYFHFYNTQSMQ